MRRRDRTARPPRVGHLCSAVNTHGEFDNVRHVQALGAALLPAYPRSHAARFHRLGRVVNDPRCQDGTRGDGQCPQRAAADRSGTTVSAVLHRVDAAKLMAALDSVVTKDALLVPDVGTRYPPCTTSARGEPRNIQPLNGETGSGRSACADGEQPPQPVAGLPAPRRGIATCYLDNYLSWFHLVGFAPSANDRACLAPP